MELDLDKIAKARQQVREAKGLAPLANPLAVGELQDQFTSKPPVSRAVAIAALFILKTSYGQLMYLFSISQSTVYESITRHVPPNLRHMRGKGRGRPLIPYEQASLYFHTIKRAGPHDNAVMLAAKLQELTKDQDFHE